MFGVGHAAADRRRTSITFSGLRIVASNSWFEIVTGPNGEPPFGGSKTPFTCTTKVLPRRRNVSLIGEPIVKVVRLRELVVDEGPVGAERARAPASSPPSSRGGSLAQVLVDAGEVLVLP